MQNNNEIKSLIKKIKKREDIDEPIFFSYNFCLLMKIFQFAFLIYIIWSTIFYILIHYYGKQIIQSNSLRIEYDNILYQNLFTNIYFTFITISGFISVSKKSIKYFLTFYLMLIIFSIFSIIEYFTDLKIFHFSKIFIFNISILIINFVIFVWTVYFFFSLVEHNKKIINSNNNSPSIIHEIQLRTDMMKMGYNHFMIKTKLNKIFRNCLFTRDSYYYASLNKPNHANADYSIIKDNHLDSTNFNSTQ
jgi:hypothetical protein